MWLSLVERVVRDDEAAGSNPVTPISRFEKSEVHNKPWQGRNLKAALYLLSGFFYAQGRIRKLAAYAVCALFNL